MRTLLHTDGPIEDALQRFLKLRLPVALPLAPPPGRASFSSASRSLPDGEFFVTVDWAVGAFRT